MQRYLPDASTQVRGWGLGLGLGLGSGLGLGVRVRFGRYLHDASTQAFSRSLTLTP